MATPKLIRETAMKLFAKYGYAGTSISNLASEVGSQKASIYSHISSKEELYLSIQDDIHDWNREYY